MLDLRQFGTIGAVPCNDFRGELPESRNFPAHIFVMRCHDVLAKQLKVLIAEGIATSIVMKENTSAE